MRTEDLDYELPEESIAQHPIEPRDSARLLVDRGPGDEPGDAAVSDLPSLLEPGDLVVVNDTRVLPARVPVVRPGGGRGEVLLVEDRGDGSWEALCRPSRRMPVGSCVLSGGGRLEVEMGEHLPDGRRLVHPRPTTGESLLDALGADGVMPLPPYIHARLEDPERYQTTFSHRPASAAAPTAGLHLTPAVFGSLAERGVGVATVELVVGLDTFRPVTTERLEDHPIHTEHYSVPAGTWEAVGETRSRGGRVVAVGTTTVRSLETVASGGPLAGRTGLFITPGFPFAAVDLLLTNFHLPRSSLLALVEAFVGPRWRDLYGAARERGYRFLSFGDAMLLGRGDPPPGEAPA